MAVVSCKDNISCATFIYSYPIVSKSNASCFYLQDAIDVGPPVNLNHFVQYSRMVHCQEHDLEGLYSCLNGDRWKFPAAKIILIFNRVFKGWRRQREDGWKMQNMGGNTTVDKSHQLREVFVRGSRNKTPIRRTVMRGSMDYNWDLVWVVRIKKSIFQAKPYLSTTGYRQLFILWRKAQHKNES